MSFSALAVFLPTFFFVSITPGMCMTLAMTMGMTIGVRRSLWMMMGELLGVALVVTCAAVGVAALILNYPTIFKIFKYGGGAYLVYIGVQMYLSRGHMSIRPSDQRKNTSRRELAVQGFITAVANPKGWAFFVVLLPPFLSVERPLFIQLFTLLAIILSIEFLCLLLYATGGRTLSALLIHDGNVKIMNRIAGTFMIGVGAWLALG